MPVESHGLTFRRTLRNLVQAARDDDEVAVEAAILDLSRSRRILQPLSLVAGALIMVLQGLKLTLSNWRLLLLQVLPASWIWLAMLDLKLHVFRGESFRQWYGATAIALMCVVIAVTVASYYLNAVFAFAIASPAATEIRPAFGRARRRLGVTAAVGSVVGLALAVSTIVVPRWGLGWFSLALSIVVAVMMVTFVTFPARLIGMSANTSTASRRDNVAATVVSGAVGALICTPAYLMGRIGVLLLGSQSLTVLGILLVALGFSLQASASGAVKAVKMSVKLVISRRPPVSTGSD